MSWGKESKANLLESHWLIMIAANEMTLQLNEGQLLICPSLTVSKCVRWGAHRCQPKKPYQPCASHFLSCLETSQLLSHMFQETQASLLVTAIFWWEHFLYWANAHCFGWEAHHTGHQYLLKTVIDFCDEVTICSWDSWSSSLHLSSTWRNLLHWACHTALFDELWNGRLAVLADSFSITLIILAPWQSLQKHNW